MNLIFYVVTLLLITFIDMTKKDFFILLTKIFGLYAMILSLFSTMPAMLSYLSLELNFMMLILALLSAALAVALFILLLFKSEYLVNKLKLADGFDEDRIEFVNFNSKNIVKLACLLLGGYLVVDNIPIILNLLFYALKYDQEGLAFGYANNMDLGVGFLNLMIGYLLIANYKFVSRILDKEKTKTE